MVNLLQIISGRNINDYLVQNNEKVDGIHKHFFCYMSQMNTRSAEYANLCHEEEEWMRRRQIERDRWVARQRQTDRGKKEKTAAMRSDWKRTYTIWLFHSDVWSIRNTHKADRNATNLNNKLSWGEHDKYRITGLISAEFGTWFSYY